MSAIDPDDPDTDGLHTRGPANTQGEQTNDGRHSAPELEDEEEHLQSAPEPPQSNGQDALQAAIDRLAALPGLQFDLIDYKAEAKHLRLDGVQGLKRAVKRKRDAAEAPEKARVKAAEAAEKAETKAREKAAAKAEADAIKAKAKAAADAIKARNKAEADAIKEKKQAEANAEKKAAAEAKKKAAAEAKAREKAAKEQERAEKKAAKERERAEKRAEADRKKKARPRLQADQDDGLGGWLPPTVLPEIIVEGGERPAIAEAGLAAMAAAKMPLYQRGKDLIRVCRTKLKLSNGKQVRVPAISIVTKPMLLRALGLCAKWLTYNKWLDLVQIDPPADLADHILGMIGEWPFPPLRGVIATQTMRYDGTLLTEPGYDPPTGLVMFNPPSMPAIPDRPTKDDALEALALLNGLLDEVRFAEDDNVSRAGAISMLMTPVLRGMMSVVPLHIVNKPAPGTGGSYMQDMMTAICLGDRCPVLSLTLHNDEENEKRLSSAALTGQPVIAIDNMVGTLLGQFLCQLVERPMPQVRLLGKSELVTIINNHCIVANGNNVAIAADMVRRTLQISLDADEENPESRTFTRNPVAEILADRGRYVGATLTIARAYRIAGSPGKLPHRLSFEEWSDTVRSALVWLGWPDCDESIRAVRAADPISAKLHAVIAAWADELIVGIGYSTGELVKLAGEYPGDGSDRIRPALWEALFAVAGNRTGQLDSARLGNWLRDHKNRVSGGYKLLNDTNDKSRPRWKLVPR